MTDIKHPAIAILGQKRQTVDEVGELDSTVRHQQEKDNMIDMTRHPLMAIFTVLMIAATVEWVAEQIAGVL